MMPTVAPTILLVGATPVPVQLAAYRHGVRAHERMNLELDCHTRRSALESVAKLYAATPDVLDSFLVELDVESYYQANDPSQSSDEIVAMLLEKHLGRTPEEPTSVCWFHLTRVRSSEQFNMGILPLDKALDGIWNMLIEIFSDSEHGRNLVLLRKEGVPEYQYELKVGDSLHGGPFAMLVREAAFCSSDIGNHDYLAIPEIVEDVCRGYEKRFGISIQSEVKAALSPCIVKFRSKRRIDRGCITAAIRYVQGSGRGEPMSAYSNTCFDGENLPVPPKDILGIEFVSAP